MFNKIIKIIIVILIVSSSAYAGSDGELILKKNEPTEITVC